MSPPCGRRAAGCRRNGAAAAQGSARVERADLLFEHALNLHTAPHTLIEPLDEALEEAAGDDVRLVRILGYRSWIRVFQADIGAALADARAALEKAELVGDPALIAAAIGQAATAEGRAAS